MLDPSSLYGKTITGLVIEDGAIHITLPPMYSNSSRPNDYAIYDAGQQCCESRFITCDDELSHFIGATFQGISLKEASAQYIADDAWGSDDEYERDDPQFLEILTDRGAITFCTHNIHNGYYGGFGIKLDTWYMFKADRG